MSLPHEGCQHEPTVTTLPNEERYLTCSRCGLCLDFRSLESLGVNMSDWAPAPEYAAPKEEKLS